MEKSEYIDKEICSKCGGKCCKKCGCTYYVTDFESLKLDYLEKELDKGYISIVSILQINELENGDLRISPFLFLRARNTNRDVIDLLSLKTRCASLTDSGCAFDIDKRPSGGIFCKPNKNNELCENKDLEFETSKWAPYQHILARIVKRRTGKSVDAKLREDVENLFFNCIMHNFEGVTGRELEEIRELIPYLERFYKDEYLKAIIRVTKTPNYVLGLKKK